MGKLSVSFTWGPWAQADSTLAHLAYPRSELLGQLKAAPAGNAVHHNEPVACTALFRRADANNLPVKMYWSRMLQEVRRANYVYQHTERSLPVPRCLSGRAEKHVRPPQPVSGRCSLPWRQEGAPTRQTYRSIVSLAEHALNKLYGQRRLANACRPSQWQQVASNSIYTAISQKHNVIQSHSYNRARVARTRKAVAN